MVYQKLGLAETESNTFLAKVRLVKSNTVTKYNCKLNATSELSVCYTY